MVTILGVRKVNYPELKSKVEMTQNRGLIRSLTGF